MIEINCDSNLKLPYIKVPEINGKFMIDTGSTRSFINPHIAQEYLNDFIYTEPFEVVSTHARSFHNQVLYAPLFKTFKSLNYHKFYVFDVDSRYQGLIGSDLLKQLDATIDMKNQVLKTKDTEIPIIYNAPTIIVVEPRCEQRVKIPTDLQNGDAILEYQDFGNGARMPSALVKCIEGFALTVIQNTCDNKLTLEFLKPIKVTKYESDECEINTYNKTQPEIDNILQENLCKLKLEHMNEEERKKIFDICSEYKDIFYSEKLPLTFSNQVKHNIRTKNEDPIYVKPYRQPPAQTAEIKRQVDKLLEDNVIQPSFSPWSAPVHLVPKKPDATGERKFRMVVDYRRLNDLTIDDKYPLPNINDLFDKLGKSSYYSVLDLASGYHQLEIEEKDRAKTAFSTQFGHFEFLRMPFGLKTAPATFQRAMDNILRGLQGIHCLIYLDDIIVFSSSLEEHLEKLRAVFDRLRQTNLKVQLDKSDFLRKEVAYLGHTITSEGLKPNNDKIHAILNYPIPRTLTEIRSFLGLIGYYRRFIKDFAKITNPLSSCLKKNKKIIIDDNFKNAFERCKELLTTAPLLQYPDFNKPFILTTDASNFALGAVLSQGSPGQDKPVAYASRSLNDTEQKYSATEKELLAIVWAVKHFRPYLYGKRFTIYSDHRALVWLYSLKEPNSKLTRWRLRLSEYDFEVVYKSGKQNTNADALSRIRVNALESDDISMKVNVDPKDEHLRQIAEDLTNQVGDDSNSTIPHRSESPVLISSDSERTVSIFGDGRKSPYSIMTPSTLSASEKSDTIQSNIETDSNGIPILKEAIDTKPNQILVYTWLKNSMTVKNLSRDHQKILEVHLPVDNIELIKDFLKQYIKPKIKYFIYFEDEEHRKRFNEAVISLFSSGTVRLIECTERVVYVDNEDEQREIVLKYHVGKTCHRGIKETITHLKRTYYWKNLSETVAAIINSCDTCKIMKYDRKPFKPELQLTQTQTGPFQEIFIDLFNIEGKYYLTLVDAFSKLGQAIEIADRSTAEVVRALIKYFSLYGVPLKISSDPGSEFNNRLMKELLSFYKIECHIGTPNNPNSMGIVERFHSTIIEIYRLAKYERKITDACTVMSYSVMAYNQTIHSVTGLTPFEVLLGHTNIKSPFHVEFEKEYTQGLIAEHKKRTKRLYEHLATKMIEMKQKIVDKKGGEKEFNINDSDDIFIKGVNNRRSKDKPKYQKAQVTGEISRNVVPVVTKNRETNVPVKDIRRPPQVHRDSGGDNHDPGPSTSKN